MEEEKNHQQTWDSLSEEQRISAAAVIFQALVDQIKEGGTYRYLVYDRLGFSSQAYKTLRKGQYISDFISEYRKDDD